MLPVQTNSTPNGSVAPPGSGAIVERLLEHLFQLVGTDGALAQQPGPLAGEVDDAGGRPVGGRSGVEEDPDVVAELLDDRRDLARGRLAGAVGAGGGQRAGALDEGEGEGLLGHAHSHRAPGLAEVPADAGGLPQDQGERPRPPGRDQRLGLVGDLVDQADGLAPGVDQHRQGQVAAALLGLEQGVDGRGVERVAADAVEGVGGQHDQAASGDDLAADLEQAWPLLLVLGDGDDPRVRVRGRRVRLGHGRLPSRTRSRPARSGCTATSVSPAAVSTAAAASAWPSPISQSSQPPGASQCPARGARRRSTSRPSGPPSRARRGSWARTSVGRVAMAPLGTYGTLAQSTSTRPASSAGRGASKSPASSSTPYRSALPAAQASAPGSSSVASTRAPGTSAARKQAIAPDPAHTSTAIRGAGAARRWLAARSARPSVSGRGTNTPGPTASRSRPNGAQPITYWSGSPAARRATMARTAGSSTASSSSQSASAAADTQPAAAS